MPDTKEQRDEEKRTITDELKEALTKLDEAKTAADVDQAVRDAQAAADKAVTMAADAFKQATKPDHTLEDEQVEEELREFATEVQNAAQNAKKVGDTKKSLKKKDGGVL